MKPIWEKRRYFEGSGTVIIPSNPNASLETLGLLMASKKAGNTGVRNELVSICDELKRQKITESNTYKKNNVFYLKKCCFRRIEDLKTQYVYGGSGLFDSIASFIARLFTSSATRQIASTAVDVCKNAAKEVGKKAFDVG